MINSVELIDRLKQVKSIHSDYKLAKFLGVTCSAVSSWRKGSPIKKNLFLKIGRMLEISEDELYYSLLIERQSDPKMKDFILRNITPPKGR